MNAGMPELKKAFIGSYVNGHMELEGRFYVPFNPTEISIEEAIGVVDVSGVDGREKQRRMKQGRDRHTASCAGILLTPGQWNDDSLCHPLF